MGQQHFNFSACFFFFICYKKKNGAKKYNVFYLDEEKNKNSP